MAGIKVSRKIFLEITFYYILIHKYTYYCSLFSNDFMAAAPFEDLILTKVLLSHNMMKDFFADRGSRNKNEYETLFF
jgi:hypothetical protein